MVYSSRVHPWRVATMYSAEQDTYNIWRASQELQYSALLPHFFTLLCKTLHYSAFTTWSVLCKRETLRKPSKHGQYFITPHNLCITQGNCWIRIWAKYPDSAGKLAWQVCPASWLDRFTVWVCPDSGECYKVLKCYVWIIYVINIDLLERWSYNLLWLEPKVPTSSTSGVFYICLWKFNW